MAALGENAGEQSFASFKCRFAISVFCEFGLCGEEAAFAGGFEDAGAVAFEVGLHPPQCCHSRLQSRELLLNLRHNPPLFVFWWKRNRQLDECLASKVLDRAASKTPLQAAVLREQFEQINEEARVEWNFESDAMKCLLKFEIRKMSVPYGGPSGFSTLTNKHIVRLEPKSVELIFLEIHFEQVVRFNGAPPHIDVPEIRQPPSGMMLRFVEHLAELHFGNFA